MLQHPRSRRATLAPAILASSALALLLAGCDPAVPTAPSVTAPATTLSSAPTRPRGVTITSLTLAATTLPIGGAATTYTVTIQNNGSKVSNAALQGDIVQGSVDAAAGGTLVSCVASSPGLLPKGTCTMSFTTSASNTTVSGGQLAPGAATFVLHLFQTAGNNKTTELANASVSISLVPPGVPYISAVTLSTTTLALDASVPFTITFQNPTGADMSEVWFQIYIDQGSVTAGANGSDLVCAPNNADGVLPSGSCTMSFVTKASSSQGLTPGAATWVVYMYQGFSNSVQLDSKSIAVTLTN